MHNTGTWTGTSSGYCSKCEHKPSTKAASSASLNLHHSLLVSTAKGGWALHICSVLLRMNWASTTYLTILACSHVAACIWSICIFPHCETQILTIFLCSLETISFFLPILDAKGPFYWSISLNKHMHARMPWRCRPIDQHFLDFSIWQLETSLLVCLAK